MTRWRERIEIGEREERESRERGRRDQRERETTERPERDQRERGEREERDAQSLQGMSLQFHFQFKNALISKGIISNRQAERTESSFHTLF